MVSYNVQPFTCVKFWYVSVPSRGMGGFLLMFNKIFKKDASKEFPSPLEVWVVSYYFLMRLSRRMIQTVSVPSRGMGGFLPSQKFLGYAKRYVSVPSRGMGGFLQNEQHSNNDQKSSFRPLSRYGWFPTPYLVSQKGNNTQDSSYLETNLSIPYFTRAFS